MLIMKLTRKQSEHLKKIADEMDITLGGVLQRAVALLSVCVREVKDGGEICFIDEENKVVKKVVGMGI